jgi:hypothetical protein
MNTVMNPIMNTVMNPNRPIFFYSKNCKICQYLAENFNINWNNYFDMINIDKKDIRDKILKSKNIKISKIPCILVSNLVNNKIIVNKYEGEIVREWIIRNILQPMANKSLPVNLPPNVNKKESNNKSPVKVPEPKKSNNVKKTNTKEKPDIKSVKQEKKPNSILKKSVSFNISKNTEKIIPNNEDEIKFIDKNEL